MMTHPPTGKAIALIVMMTGCAHQGDAMTTKTIANGHVAVNGIDYYYEIHGTGEPLLLLHGGLGSIDMFRPALADFASTRKVIAIDLQGHGRTTLGEREIDLSAIADDVAHILAKLAVT